MDITCNRGLDATYVTVREDGKYVAGAILYHSNHHEGASIWSVQVDEEYRGKGYGMVVVNAALAEAIDLGIKKLYLTVNKDNYIAINLYASLGFKIRGSYARRSTSWVMWWQTYEDTHEVHHG
jgi:ribosomal protein S18 acetylase RimI-like enzyme